MGRPCLTVLLAITLAVAAAGCGGVATALKASPKDEAVVWAVGDGDDSSASQKVVSLVEGGDADRFLYLGDVYETGTPAEYSTHYDTSFGRLADITTPTVGNHEYGNRAEGYDTYWKGEKGHDVGTYYDFEIAGWQVLSLNSEAPHDAGSEQVNWLHEQLRESGNCRIAFWHRPRYSGGEHGDQPDIAPLWDALRGKAALVLNGHEHDMQRLRPIDGITELIAGAGGHGLYPVKRQHRIAFVNDRDYGALRLELSRGEASYVYFADDGRRLDAGDVTCRP
jgi:hypothetical protein